MMKSESMPAALAPAQSMRLEGHQPTTEALHQFSFRGYH